MKIYKVRKEAIVHENEIGAIITTKKEIKMEEYKLSGELVIPRQNIDDVFKSEGGSSDKLWIFKKN